MLHALKERFQLELINLLLSFSPSSHLIVVFFFPVGLLSYDLISRHAVAVMQWSVGNKSCCSSGLTQNL